MTRQIELHQLEALRQCALSSDGVGFIRDTIAVPLMKMGYLTVCTPTTVKRWRLTKEGWAKLKESEA